MQINELIIVLVAVFVEGFGTRSGFHDEDRQSVFSSEFFFRESVIGVEIELRESPDENPSLQSFIILVPWKNMKYRLKFKTPLTKISRAFQPKHNF